MNSENFAGRVGITHFKLCYLPFYLRRLKPVRTRRTMPCLLQEYFGLHSSEPAEPQASHVFYQQNKECNAALYRQTSPTSYSDQAAKTNWLAGVFTGRKLPFLRGLPGRRVGGAGLTDGSYLQQHCGFSGLTGLAVVTNSEHLGSSAR